MQDTEIAPLTPQSEEPALGPAPREPSIEAPEPTTQETPPADEVGDGETPPAPFGGMPANEVMEHDDIRPLVEERVETGRKESYDKAYSDIQARLSPLATKGNELLEAAKTSADQVLVTLRRAAQDGTLDQRAVEDLLMMHKPQLDALGGVHRARGVKEALDGIASLVGVRMSPAAEMGFQEWAAGKSPDSGFVNDFVGDIKSHITKEIAKEAEEKGFQRGLKEGKAAQAAKQKVQTPTGEPNISPGSPGGGHKYTAAQWTAMTTAQRNKAREEGRHPLA